MSFSDAERYALISLIISKSERHTDKFYVDYFLMDVNSTLTTQIFSSYAIVLTFELDMFYI